MRRIIGLLGVLALAGCVTAAPPPDVVRPVETVAARTSGGLPPREAARNFVTVVERLEPVAEAYCRNLTRRTPCDFRIVVDDRPGQPPNAFQTLDSSGRPILGFTVALVATARNADELAFVMGHEAAHHIRGHIPQVEQSALSGAIAAGILASIGGADAAGVRAAQDLGATVGARRFSKEFELQADALGAEIAFRAGFDPLRGAQFFSRLPDPGDRFLGTHPPNSARVAIVRQVTARLRAGG